MFKSKKQKLHSCLADLRTKVRERQLEGCYQITGICAFVTDHMGYGIITDLNRLIKSWPDYSGDSGYPISHKILKPDDAFHKLSNLWYEEEHCDELDKQYVRDRINLLYWCIQELEKQIADQARWRIQEYYFNPFSRK